MSESNSSRERREYSQSRLCRLIGLLCDEAISREEQAELEGILLADPAAREQFLEDLAVHAALEGEIAARGKVFKVVESSRNGDAGWWQFTKSAIPAAPSRLPDVRVWRRYAPLAAAILLTAVASMLWHFGWTPAGLQNPHPGVADSQKKSGDSVAESLVIASVSPKSDDCHWMFEDQNIFEVPKDSVRSEVCSGETLRVVAGSLDVVFNSGVAVTLSAPAILEINSPMRGRLIRGRATVKVCPGAEGFTINTPRTSVIDLGTIFGVEVDDFGRTDIVVFKGMVDIAFSQRNDTDNPSLGSQRLYMGEAVRVDERGTLSRIISINGNDFSVNAPAQSQQSSASAVISSVRDNIKRQETWKFYEIVPGGMREDAKAFVDRLNHEWNGVDATGMPKYLLGGDYVKPFNNDKMIKDIEVRVTLEKPATLYILWCNRVPPPDWLREGFEDTGDVIGVDEGYHVFEDGTVHDKEGPGVGPGVSIDSVHTVWRRVVPEPGIVHLGPTGAGVLDDLNMYGIVAVPL